MIKTDNNPRPKTGTQGVGDRGGGHPWGTVLGDTPSPSTNKCQYMSIYASSFAEIQQKPAHFHLRKLLFIKEVSAAGIEPATHGLKGRCSTD